MAGSRDGLAPVQERVLGELRTRGISLVSWDELIGDGDLWQRLETEMDAFVRSATEQLEAGRVDERKDYLIRGMPHGTGVKGALKADGPWIELGVGDAVLGVVNAYRGFETKLYDFDQWYTIPLGGDRERIVSQQWHRDPLEPHIVKLFLYFNDVDEEAGPFEYIPESVEGAKYGHLWPLVQGESRYPPPGAVEEAVPASERILAAGPAGTLIFCDTGGFHRGGYAISKPRILATFTYVSPDSTNVTKKRRFKVEGDNPALSARARFALT